MRTSIAGLHWPEQMPTSVFGKGSAERRADAVPSLRKILVKERDAALNSARDRGAVVSFNLHSLDIETMSLCDGGGVQARQLQARFFRAVINAHRALKAGHKRHRPAQ